MSRRLRVIIPGEAAEPIEIGEAIIEIAREAAAACPTAAMVIWELDGVLHARGVPDSTALKRGIIDTMFTLLNPESTSES